MIANSAAYWGALNGRCFKLVQKRIYKMALSHLFALSACS